MLNMEYTKCEPQYGIATTQLWQPKQQMAGNIVHHSTPIHPRNSKYHTAVTPFEDKMETFYQIILTLSTVCSSLKRTKPKPLDLFVTGSVFRLQCSTSPNLEKYSLKSSEERRGRKRRNHFIMYSFWTPKEGIVSLV